MSFDTSCVNVDCPCYCFFSIHPAAAVAQSLFEVLATHSVCAGLLRRAARCRRAACELTDGHFDKTGCST
jgi:hypothetical protein